MDVKNIDAIEAGQEAVYLAGAIRGVVDAKIREKATALIAIYRQGSIDHDMLVGKVAEMAALEELLSELESRQRRGASAREREFGNAKTT